MDSKICFENECLRCRGNMWTMCEFHDCICNGLGDTWWTDKCTYFSSIVVVKLWPVIPVKPLAAGLYTPLSHNTMLLAVREHRGCWMEGGTHFYVMPIMQWMNTA